MSNNARYHTQSTNLPSDVEGDHPPCGTFSTTRNAFLNNYPPHHPIALGSSTFSRGPPPTSQEYDIAPKVDFYKAYKEESARIKTFYDWPSFARVKKDDLAHNGFIYLHVADRTQCVFCRSILSNWETGDIVENEHKRNCPECPLAFGYECGNKPIVRQVRGEELHPPSIPVPQSTYSTTVQVQTGPTNSYQHTYHMVRGSLNGEDEVGHIANNRADASGSFHSNESSQIGQLPSIPQQQSISGGNVSITDAPKYPQWSNEQTRLQSFMGWPAQMSQKPRELAQAGLIYMATGDRCKCFWCGGELYEWEPLDVPMEEHAKWFPNCNFVRQLKGADYIQYVKDKQHGLIVEPTEFMSKPHVLAVLQSGYTHEQVQEVVNRNGVTKLVSANDIIRAIEETKQERLLLQQRYSNNTTHHAVQPQSAPIAEDEDVSMDIEENEVNQVEQRNRWDTTNSGMRRRIQAYAEDKPTSALTSKQTPDNDVNTVLQENEKLKDQKLCKICMDRDLSITFLPCSHLVTCSECSVNLTECPVCRKQIEQKVKVYWG